MKPAEIRIKTAAFHLAKERPYKSITVEEIIKEANVAKASFYYYYKDKYDLGTALFKDVILNSLADPSYKEFKWSARIKQIYNKLIRNRTFLFNLIIDDRKMQAKYIELAHYYYESLVSYIKYQGGDIDSIAIRKACHNVSQTDMMVVHYYCSNKIDDKALTSLASCWSETAPHILHQYVE